MHDARELNQLRWGLGQAVLLIGVLGSFAIDIGASAMGVAMLVLLTVSLFRPVVITWIPAWLLTMAPYALLTLLAADFLLSAGDVLPPLYRMLLWLILFRALQARSPREDLQALLLSFFLVIATGVLSQDLIFAFQILVYAPMAMLVLFVVHLASAGLEPEAARRLVPDLRAVRWRSVMDMIGQFPLARLGLIGAGLYFLLTILALGLFLSLPRFDIGQSLPFPRLQARQSLVGFTDNIRYGDLSGILEDNSIAMRVDVEMENPPALPYWRMAVLDAYVDHGFRVSPDVTRRHRLITSNTFYSGRRVSGDAGASRWTVYLEGGVSSFIPIGSQFSILRFNSRQSLQAHELVNTLQTREIAASTLSMRFEDLAFADTQPAYREDLPLRGHERVVVDARSADYLNDVTYPLTTLAVPAGEANASILNGFLNQLGPRGDANVREFSERIVDLLRLGRGYSLEVRIPPGDAELPLRWLESGSAGHCELYAGAFVLISRYAGIPSRLVTGFVGGDWNGFESYFMVRNRHAHAWCEVFDPDEGWIRIDPTPGYGGASESVDAALAQGRMALDRTFRAYLDSLRILWFRRVIQFDRGDQEQIVRDLRSWFKQGIASLRAPVDFVRGLFNSGDSQAMPDTDPRSKLLPIAFILLAAALVTALARRILTRHNRHSLERITRHRAGVLLRRADQLTGPAPQPTLTLLQQLRFGPLTSWPADTNAALRQCAKALRGKQL